MSFLRRWFGRPRRPEWAAFMPATDFLRFADTLRATLKRHCPRHEIDFEQGVWRPLAKDDEREFGLLNLAQVFQSGGGALAVDDFVRNTLQVQAQVKDAPPATFEDVRSRLRVRLFPTEFPHAPLVTAPVSEQFITALVADYPDHVQSIVADDARKWEVPTAKLFDIALDNVWDHEPIEFEELPGPGVGTVYFGANDHFYAASHALLLERHLEVEPLRGVVVAVPNRHVVIYHPVESPDSVAVIKGLPLMAQGLYEQGPGSITPALLWWRSGQFRTIEYGPNGDLVGPVELQEAIRDLIS